MNGSPALIIHFRTNVYPVLVKLIAPDKRTVVDWVKVELSEDIPVALYLLVEYSYHSYNWAPVPGTYDLRFIYKDKVVLHVPLTIRGASLKLYNVLVSTNYYPFYGWRLTAVKLTVKNTGDSPAYIGCVDVYVGDQHTWFPVQGGTVTVLPGQARQITTEDMGALFGLPLTPGSCYVKIVIHLGTGNFSYEGYITVG